jgi:hypothetical protein
VVQGVARDGEVQPVGAGHQVGRDGQVVHV